RDPTRGRAAGAADADVPVQLFRLIQQTQAVLGVHVTDVDAGGGALERMRRDARSLQRFPGAFEEQPLLRIDALRLAGADPEERRIEALSLVEKAAVLGDRFAERARVRIIEVGQIPAATLWKGADRVRSALEEAPHRFRR